MAPRKKSGDTGDRVKSLIYGGYNAGKTHFLGTAADDERTAPMLLLDMEGGLKTLQGHPGLGTNILTQRCHGWADFNDAFERVESNDEGIKSVGLDSISETHNYAIEQILVEAEARRKPENKDLVEQQDYGKALIQLRRLVREFRDLPLHFFCTAHGKEFTHAQRGLIVVPNLYGKGAFEIPGLLETVGYMAVMEDEDGEEFRSLLLRNYPKLDLKVRTPWGVVAPEEIERPTMTKFLDALGYTY